MKRKKWLLLTGAGLVSIVLLACSAMAAEDPSVDISITESTSAPSDSVYQLSGEPVAAANAGENFQSDTLPYPVDIQLLPQGDLRYLHKTYTVVANYSPDLLVEEPFSQGGYRYRFSEIIQKEAIPGHSSKTVTQSKSMESEADDKAALLALLGEQLPYSDADGYRGELFLMPETLSVQETGKESYSYTVTAVREYTDLENKDWALVPKTTEKNGMTLGRVHIRASTARAK